MLPEHTNPSYKSVLQEHKMVAAGAPRQTIWQTSLSLKLEKSFSGLRGRGSCNEAG
jgi:methylglyoxal synthase